MGVEPKIGGLKPPKWMVKIMENPIIYWMIWGENTPICWKHPYFASKNSVIPKSTALAAPGKLAEFTRPKKSFSQQVCPCLDVPLEVSKWLVNGL